MRAFVWLGCCVCGWGKGGAGAGPRAGGFYSRREGGKRDAPALLLALPASLGDIQSCTGTIICNMQQHVDTRSGHAGGTAIAGHTTGSAVVRTGQSDAVASLTT
jgi:hypothetical protein